MDGCIQPELTGMDGDFQMKTLDHMGNFFKQNLKCEIAFLKCNNTLANLLGN